MQLSSYDDGDEGEYKGVGFVEICNIFAIYRTHFSLNQYHLTVIRLVVVATSDGIDYIYDICMSSRRAYIRPRADIKCVSP